MDYKLDINLVVEIDAPTELDAIELASDTFGDAMDIHVVSMEIKPNKDSAKD